MDVSSPVKRVGAGVKSLRRAVDVVDVVAVAVVDVVAAVITKISVIRLMRLGQDVWGKVMLDGR